MRAILLVLVIIVSGCTHIADRYSPLADNVATIRGVSGLVVNVGRFTAATGIATTELPCAAVAIAPPDGESFADYIRAALIAELKMANAYSSSAPITITGRIDALEVEASAFSLTGHWIIEVTIYGNGKSLTVSERYSFRSQTLSMTSCEAAARRFSSAVQNLVGKIVGSPEFVRMVKLR